MSLDNKLDEYKLVDIINALCGGTERFKSFFNNSTNKDRIVNKNEFHVMLKQLIVDLKK